MQYKTSLASALLLAAAVQAQSSSGSSSPSHCTFSAEATVTSQAELDKFAQCKQIKGDIRVTGDLENAALANVEKIDGSFVITNASHLLSFSADSLKSVTKSLSLQELTRLTTASFGSLADVDVIELLHLPNIETFNSNLKRAERITISDTSLEAIEGFEALENISLMDINNNLGLATINSRVKTISNSLYIGFNGRQSNITFDNLLWANNITVRSVSAVSFKSLEKVNNTLNFQETSAKGLSMKNLTNVGSSLAIIDNKELTSVDFESLTAVSGALVVANNTELKQITGFENLQTIGNALIAEGSFNRFDLDNLKSVKGGGRVKSSASNFSCDALDSLKGNGIQGTFSCESNKESSSSSGSSNSGKGSGSTSKGGDSSSKTEEGGKKNAGIAQLAPVSSFMGAFAAVAVALL